jgi:hypothetical protein
MAYIHIVHTALRPHETLKIVTKYTLVFSYYNFSFQLLLVRLIKTKIVPFFFLFFLGGGGAILVLEFQSFAGLQLISLV